jgi:tetratricopeptide (TPR) repeat protein
MLATLDSFRSSLPKLAQRFTTPSLDFKSHSLQLEDYVNQLYLYRATLQTETIDHDRKQILSCLVYDFLQLFNNITTAQRKSRNPKDQPISQHNDFNSLKEEDLDTISTHDFDPTLSNSQRAKYHYIRGKVLNIFESYHKGAEENLSKCVKLDPYFIPAWKQLGESFWNKGDLEQSQNCFEFILDLDENQADVLGFLAMVKRRNGASASDFGESIRLCKKAIEVDPEYIEAWVGLGSTFMALYFKLTHDIKDLHRALEAYDNAIGSTNPDLYYSRAIIHQYLENIDESISDLKKTSELDRNLEFRCKHTILNMKKYVREVGRGLESKV